MGADTEQRLRRLIHVARRDLQLDEDTYRAALAVGSGTGKTSTSHMAAPELHRVVEHFKRRGFVVRPATGAGTRPQAADEQSKLIRHLWLRLHKVGAVRDPSEAALAAWVKRETGVEALQWIDGTQASASIEKLKKWLERL